MEEFNIFDTVQVHSIGSMDFTRGFILYNKLNYKRYYDVVIGKHNNDIPLWIGNDIVIVLCNMVLVEKFDKRLQLALEKTMDGRYFIL